eukprot:XP_028339187.1 uncharacterized protein LOC114484784 [Physeter catodon]
MRRRRGPIVRPGLRGETQLSPGPPPGPPAPRCFPLPLPGSAESYCLIWRPLFRAQLLARGLFLAALGPTAPFRGARTLPRPSARTLGFLDAWKPARLRIFQDYRDASTRAQAAEGRLLGRGAAPPGGSCGDSRQGPGQEFTDPPDPQPPPHTHFINEETEAWRGTGLHHELQGCIEHSGESESEKGSPAQSPGTQEELNKGTEIKLLGNRRRSGPEADSSLQTQTSAVLQNHRELREEPPLSMLYAVGERRERAGGLERPEVRPAWGSAGRAGGGTPRSLSCLSVLV